MTFFFLGMTLLATAILSARCVAHVSYHAFPKTNATVSLRSQRRNRQLILTGLRGQRLVPRTYWVYSRG